MTYKYTFRPIAMLFGAVLSCSLCAATSSPPEEAYSAGAEKVQDKLAQARAGNVDEQFVNALAKLTDINMRMGKYATAVHSAEPLLEFFAIQYGSEHPNVAGLREALAEIYINLNRLEDAVDQLNQAREIYAKDMGVNSSQYIRTLNTFIVCRIRQKQYPEAATMLSESTELSSRYFGERSPQVAVAYDLYGILYKEQGKSEQSVVYQHKAAEIRKESEATPNKPIKPTR